MLSTTKIYLFVIINIFGNIMEGEMLVRPKTTHSFIYCFIFVPKLMPLLLFCNIVFIDMLENE